MPIKYKDKIMPAMMIALTPGWYCTPKVRVKKLTLGVF